MSGARVLVTMRDFFFDDPFFKNSWEDFDRVRDAMFTETRDKWLKFDEDFRNMACMTRFQVSLGERLDVPQTLDVARPQHGLPHRD